MAKSANAETAGKNGPIFEATAVARGLLRGNPAAGANGRLHGRRETMMVPAMLDAKGTRILAESLFKELRENGYSRNQILSVSTELIDLVTEDLKARSAVKEPEQAH